MKPITRNDLKPFQIEAAGELATMIQEFPGGRFLPRYDSDTGEALPFICRLRAITGAGKTPILALAANHLQNGIILWTTNRGAVISQTLNNLRPSGRYASLLPENTSVYSLAEMSNSDWDDVMTAKNGLTILMATVASFNQEGDKLRVHNPRGGTSRWKMLAGHGEDGRRRPLYVFYDEGHGATEKQFLKLRELKPRAFALASASDLPEDLHDLLRGNTPEEKLQSLRERTVVVPTKAVVQAGLLKNRLYFVDCDTTQFDAVSDAHKKWAELSRKLSLHEKTPIACFIVNETSRGVDIWEQLVKLGVEKTRIAVHLNGARDEGARRYGSTQGLIDTYTGRKADDRSPEALRLGGYTHLIWNLTLREGWDEPLAYVAYIDDRGRSVTDIVQKIGRFVRQPEATPFDDPDLNSAYFYFNIADEEFTSLIRTTQTEMETEGYEIIGMRGTRLTPTSRESSVIRPMTAPSIVPWFGDNLARRDNILINNISLYDSSQLQASGAVAVRVFDMEQMREDESRRRDEQRDSNDIITPWTFLMTQLSAVDSRIANDDGTVFSSSLKMHEKMSQKMQYGSPAMVEIKQKVEIIRTQLNEELSLMSLGRHGIYEVQPFRLVSPNIESVSETQREKYKVRKYSNSVHEEYNGMNSFEVKVAEALDSLGKTWCRNPVGGYRIPIAELGADTIWFYPDFLLWTENELWAIDPKGKHILEAAVAQKLLDLSDIKGLTKPVRVAFVLEGSYIVDKQGAFIRHSKVGMTLVRKTSRGVRSQPFDKLSELVGNF
jgi:type III restriction enzyme